MDEAEKHGGVFDGVVGRLINEEVTIERTFVFSGTFKECEKDHDKQTGGDNSDPRKRFQLDITSEQIDKTAFEDESKNTEPSDEKGLEQKGNLGSEISPSTPAAPAMTQQRGSVIWAFTTTVPTNMALASDPTCEEPSIVVPACYNFKRKNTKWSKLDSRYPVTVRPGVRRSMWHNIASAPNMAGWAVTITLGAFFIAIIGGISHFRSGSSTRAQRAWIMTWINYGIYARGLWRPSVYGLTETWRQLLRGRRTRESLDYKFFFGFALAHMSLIVACVYSIPAIGGFVVVAKMLREYGDCQRI
ncbi:hypothetical protein BKA65DRAFT_566056 [Rhexocercosporidium sp. MPI-PUGE-AT-0058]|nr:hypothetical protein BKA65DRAFT_566056 [Rhexocercosporidium sp. MPI-PUGE-AT-0058]